jgi:hypothetical protein
MVQDDEGKNEVEWARGQSILIADDEVHIADIGVELAGLRNHRRGYVNPDARVELLGQRSRKPTDAAAEIHCVPAVTRQAMPLGPGECPGDFGLPSGEELAVLPSSVPLLGRGHDRPERIEDRQVLPVALVRELAQ